MTFLALNIKRQVPIKGEVLISVLGLKRLENKEKGRIALWCGVSGISVLPNCC